MWAVPAALSRSPARIRGAEAEGLNGPGCVSHFQQEELEDVTSPRREYQ